MAVSDQRREAAGFAAFLHQVRVERDGLAGVFEKAAMAGVQKAFGGGPFGDQRVVAVKFDMPVGDVRAGKIMRDEDAVDQVFRLDQRAVQQQGVVWGDDEVAAGDAVSEGAGGDANWADCFGARMFCEAEGAPSSMCRNRCPRHPKV